jgi:hypothetical protein
MLDLGFLRRGRLFAGCLAAATSFGSNAAIAHDAPSLSNVVTVKIARTAGTCPRAMQVSVVTTRFDGGATFDVTARTASVADPTQLVSATVHRIDFAARVIPTYATCEGAGRSSGYAFTFDRGKVAFVMTIAGEVDEPPVLIDVSADPPHVKFAQPD